MNPNKLPNLEQLDLTNNKIEDERLEELLDKWEENVSGAFIFNYEIQKKQTTKVLSPDKQSSGDNALSSIAPIIPQ